MEYILPKLSSAIFVIRRLSYILNLEKLQMVYIAYFHPILRYGVIFWDNSTDAYKVFKLQKKAIRIVWSGFQELM